jgi:hypothetical protein
LRGAAAGEYVVKLRAEIRESGLLNELIAAKLAAHFGLASPDPALIMITPALAELIAAAQPSQAARIRGSVGLNFGTLALTGVGTWPVDRFIPEAMWQQATDIFAFDALIQNPDRRFNNANLFARGDSLFIFDHETAFSFLAALISPTAPWKLADQGYLRDHVFYKRLRSKTIDLTGFTASLRSLSNLVIAGMVADVPDEWNNENVAKIEGHLRAVRDNAWEFGQEVRRMLA